ncbi:MAG: branched-subunit amino acid aminotransferase/4-amino-4-deoxychorismate lyase [Glaciecola sp.]
MNLTPCARTVWIDGNLVPAHEATVSAYDRAFRSGEGVFETFRAYGRFVFRLDEHLQRAVFGASVLSFELPPVRVLAAGVQAAVDDNVAPDAAAAVRLVATPGDIDPESPFPGSPLGHPRIVVTVHDLLLDDAARDRGATAIVVPWGREVAHVKAVSYLASALARREARRQGADEALLTDADDNVLEASGANLFAVIDGRLVTPPIDGTILPGVTRQVVLDVAEQQHLEVAQVALPLRELLQADEAMLTATTREIVPLTRVDGSMIGTGRMGPITRELMSGFADVVRREAAR